MSLADEVWSGVHLWPIQLWLGEYRDPKNSNDIGILLYDIGKLLMQHVFPASMYV